jgi:hypothetical protein
MSNEGTTQLSHVNFVVPTLDMAYPSPSCLCSRPTLHFPSVCHVNFVVPTLDMAYPSPSCLCSRPTLHFPSDMAN